MDNSHAASIIRAINELTAEVRAIRLGTPPLPPKPKAKRAIKTLRQMDEEAKKR